MSKEKVVTESRFKSRELSPSKTKPLADEVNNNISVGSLLSNEREVGEGKAKKSTSPSV